MVSPSLLSGGRRGVAEIDSLTTLRGYLALWVVFYHYWNDVLRLFPGMEAATPFIRVGVMAVPMFFMLSGFVLAYNYGERFGELHRREVSRFLWMRLARVYPVHFVTLFMVLAMVVVGDRTGHQVSEAGYSTRDFVLNLFLIHTWVPEFELNWNYPSRSISSEWFAYLLFPLMVYAGLRHLTTPLRATVAATLSLVGAVAMPLCWRPWPYYELLLVVPTFLAGACAYWMLRGRIDTGRSTTWRRAPDLLLLTMIALTFFRTSAVVVTSLLVGMQGLLLLLAWLGSGCSRLWTAWPVVYLGEVSYSLFMTHTLAQKVVYRVLPSTRFVDADPLTKLGILAVYVVLIVIFCLATYYLVERPSRVFFKKLARRPVASSPSPGGPAR